MGECRGECIGYGSVAFLRENKQTISGKQLLTYEPTFLHTGLQNTTDFLGGFGGSVLTGSGTPTLGGSGGGGLGGGTEDDRLLAVAFLVLLLVDKSAPIE